MDKNKCLKARSSNYDKYPFVEIHKKPETAVDGWKNILKVLNQHIRKIKKDRVIVVIDYYPGVYEEELKQHLINPLEATDHFCTMEFFKSEEKLREMTFSDVTDDPVFGFMTRLKISDFFDKENFSIAQQKLKNAKGLILIYGYGASLLTPMNDVLVYADMPRWEIQTRFRKNEINNLGVLNKDEKASIQFKRGYFVDWRVADCHKKEFMKRWDYVLDTTDISTPKLIGGEDYRNALENTVSRPFRVVPFFDPGVWGGQWMKEVCNLDRKKENFAWCFDCVPEENSLFLKFGDLLMETPAINLVFYQSKKLLGEPVQARFGDEFPIRFDLLDTMEGGNLSLQVHPTTEYIQKAFGMHYTQDESYYLLDAKEDAEVYIGLKESVNPSEMIDKLETAQNESATFEAKKYISKWPVKQHDHILIPAGTVHCSGKNCMVLEISATPYIFTFKLWDWGRLGLDGKPRPINIERGKKVIDWERKETWINEQLINRIEKIREGDNWSEEKTGLHETEFIETRRYWFSSQIYQQTNNSVNVLNLVEGQKAIVESPVNAFEPFIVNYIETFIVPATVKEYTIRPYGESEGQKLALIKAYVKH